MKIIITESLRGFIKSLNKEPRSKVTRYIDLLERFGYRLSMPYSKKIESNLFELRIRGKVEIRIFYTFRRNRIILFYAYTKKTNKIPKRVLRTAKRKLETLDI